VKQIRPEYASGMWKHAVESGDDSSGDVKSTDLGLSSVGKQALHTEHDSRYYMKEKNTSAEQFKST